MGCFNISALHNFDTNRIFDLTHYRIWDLVLWWYDVDLIIFDFFLEFFNCVSFLLLFINTFFYKIFFNFLNFTLILNVNNHLLVLDFCFINFFFFYIFFFFNVVYNFIFFYFELFYFIDLYFNIDTHIVSMQYTYVTVNTPVVNVTFFYFIFFFFVLFFYVYIYIFSIKNIFSVVCEINPVALDINVSMLNTSAGITLFFNSFYVFKHTFLISNTRINSYFFIGILRLFLLVLFTLLSVFFLVHNLYYSNSNIQSNIQYVIVKQNKYFFKLENTVLIIVFKFFKNDVIKHLQINLITFIINFFSYVIKDLTYINSITYFFFAEFFYSIKSFNTICNINSNIYTQLTYVKNT